VHATANVSERRRVLECLAVGLAAGGVASPWSPWQLSVLLGWIAAGGLLLARVWASIAPLDATLTRILAAREDDSRSSARVLLLSAAAVSLVAVAFGLSKATKVPMTLDVLLTLSAVVGVVIAWAVVHTVYTLRYAHLYYGGDAIGGIEYNSNEPPDYLDFAYVAFTIGMTFQVSDTNLQQSRVRRVALSHALISYVFGTAIIAVTINILAGFVR
jgi:uncharacterized membrane protein